MNEPSERLLESITPPAGGWERLRARRDAEELQRAPWLAFAAGFAVAALGVVLVSTGSRAPLTLPDSGARLQGRTVADEPLRLLDSGHASSLPATAGVQIYWTER
jgi:hypothetical protein